MRLRGRSLVLVVLALAAAITLGAGAAGAGNDEKTIRKLVKQLEKDRDAGERAYAADMLGTMRATSAIPALMAALKDSDPGVRQNAAGSLWEMHEHEAAKAAIPALEATLDDPDMNVLVNVTGALRALEADPSSYVGALRRIRDAAPDCDDRVYAAKALWGYGPAADLLPASLDCLDSRDSDAARDASTLLGRIVKARDAKSAVPLLADALATDRREAVRLGAAKALGTMGAPAQGAVPALKLAAREDRSPAVRDAAAKAVLEVEVKR